MNSVSADLQSTRLQQDLLRPVAFAAVAPTSGVSLVETHISWVFLLDRDVFKVKRPVDLGFLNFRSREQRRQACEEEVRLNSRLAPDVYRGVVPVTRSADRRCIVGGAGPAIDWAVHMVRLPDPERADCLLSAGQLTSEIVDRIASRIAAFHSTARADKKVQRYGRTAAILRNVEENFQQAGRSLTGYVGISEAAEIERGQRQFVREHAELFEGRIAARRIREGHGDLRLEHVYIDDAQIRVLDCIEFNERFRYADTCADIAFLAMDLAAHGRVDLAERLLASYAREADDYDLYSLVDFYAGYRAFVRGKVASFLASDRDVETGARQRAQKEARHYYTLALAEGRRSLLSPAVVAVGGIIASGKSTVAARLGAMMSAPVIEADRTRKGMLGVNPFQRIDEVAWSGAYTPSVSKRVYHEILRRAEVVLSSGRAVVLDASFRSADLRRAARELARAHGVPFRFVECRAPRDRCLDRLAVRERQHVTSDGRRAVFDDFCAGFEPVEEFEPKEHLVVDTTKAVAKIADELRRHIDTWPVGLVS